MEKDRLFNLVIWPFSIASFNKKKVKLCTEWLKYICKCQLKCHGSNNVCERSNKWTPLELTKIRSSVRVRKWSQDRKWSPNWTANDPGPEMIPILDRKWSRSKNKEWHGFISEEGENMYKNYELKNIFYHFTKKDIPQLLFCSSKGTDRFHCHAIKKIINRNWPMEEAKKLWCTLNKITK